MRYSSFVDLHRVAYSAIAAGIGVCILHQIQVHTGITPYIVIPRFESAILIFIVATMLMWGLRIIVKSLHDTYRGNDSIQKVFIYGCMQGGIALAKSLSNESPQKYRLRGFISNDKSLSGSWLLGEQVYYDDDSVVEVMKKYHVTALLVSPLRRDKFIKRTTLIDALIKAGIKILISPPGVEEWDGKSELSHHQLREVEIEDLLPREKIEVDLEAIGAMLRGKPILITGAAGSIGSEMARQVAKLHRNPTETDMCLAGIFLFNFWTNSAVTPTNNDSEKALRPAKTKLKVSGCFRTEAGAQNYATVASVIQTAVKNGQNPFEVLRVIATLALA